MNAYLFNYSHDLALACDNIQYTPPRNVRIMERDLASLWALLPNKDVSYHAESPVWGWDKALVHSLSKLGYRGLPNLTQLAHIRRLSSRSTAVELLQKMHERLWPMPVVGRSVFATTMSELQTALCDPVMLLKEPFSCSGRGLRMVKGELGSVQKNWAMRCMREQGGVVVEPYYQKVQDMAMEFTCTAHNVNYDGLSVFITGSNNNYLGNVVAPQSVLEQRIAKIIGAEMLTALREALQYELGKIFLDRYLGPLGVDMMIVESAGVLAVHPCVEINVRRTMGGLSLYMADLLAPDRQGFFQILYDSDHAKLVSMVEAMPKAEYSDAQRLLGGTKRLTPLTDVAHYVALLAVTE